MSAKSGDDKPRTQQTFARLAGLHAELIRHGLPLDTLSMGMSADLEPAILQGSTMVRIGTDLLGPRPTGGDAA